MFPFCINRYALVWVLHACHSSAPECSQLGMWQFIDPILVRYHNPKIPSLPEYCFEDSFLTVRSRMLYGISHEEIEELETGYLKQIPTHALHVIKCSS